jgi:UDP-N-acetylmuramoylalanine--D-glutamate ligase
MAKSGLAAVALLRDQGAVVTACDERPIGELADSGGVLDGISFRPQNSSAGVDQDLVVLSPGVAMDSAVAESARAVSVPVVGELELASYFLQGPSIGITGSNGKTTTTALTGHILRTAGLPVQVGGNIGTPPAAMITSSKTDQWNVLELSSFQLETISNFRARVGVCLNLTPDHLDRHHTMEIYASAKARLFETQTQDDFAVLNADDPGCMGIAGRTKARVVWFSLTRAITPGVWLADGLLHFDGDVFLRADEIPLRGMHNVENVMAASAAARLAGASLDAISAGVRGFPGVEHRLEFVRTVSGVEYFNDSKATNVDAVLKAIAAFDQGLWIILGGKDKGSDYTPLREPLRKKARAALLIGSAAEKIASELDGAVPLVRCGDVAGAVKYAATQAEAGDTVLLAPACASFDQFLNYEERGKFFKTLVGGLGERRTV